MSNLYQASRQWAERPADERFWTLAELYERTKEYADESVEASVPLHQCVVEPFRGQDLVLMGPSGGGATFQHYSFGQLSGIIKAPANYLRELPADLAARNMTHGLQQVRGQHNLLFHKNGGRQLRCVVSSQYSRIWNWEIAEMALALEEGEGWRTPPARPSGVEGIQKRVATEADVLRKSAHPSLGIKVGDTISPAGLYASDHDCFIFQVNEDRAIEGGNGETLYRGVFWQNSEVGDARFRATLFLYDSICGNHIVWGAKVLSEVSIIHKGDARQQFASAMAQITENMDRESSDDARRIQAAKRKLLGASKDEVVTLVFGKNFGLTRRECEDSYALAERHAEDHGNNPNSAWGFAAGVTRLSQGKFADKRNDMDRAAGRILEMAF